MLLIGDTDTRSRSRIASTAETLPPPRNLNLRDADVILQSSDHVNFRVHKAVLAASSPFFNDMFSLAQPADDEIVDGFPVVRLSENAEVLHSLITVLYPIPSAIPYSYDKVLDLLAALQKYDMVAVQSSVRAEVSRKTYMTLIGTGSFHAYAIACSKRLTPEMESDARLTLDNPMTFESIGDEVSLFDGWALRDLARFRKRCRDSVVLCLETFLDPQDGPSKVWVCCPQTTKVPSVQSAFPRPAAREPPVLAGWLHDFISQNIRELQKSFTSPLLERSSFRKQYLNALRTHIRVNNCTHCSKQHVMEGESFWEQLQNKVTLARDMVGFLLSEGFSTASEAHTTCSHRYALTLSIEWSGTNLSKIRQSAVVSHLAV
jgi:BTB/POZ domain